MDDNRDLTLFDVAVGQQVIVTPAHFHPAALTGPGAAGLNRVAGAGMLKFGLDLGGAEISRLVSVFDGQLAPAVAARLTRKPSRCTGPLSIKT